MSHPGSGERPHGEPYNKKAMKGFPFPEHGPCFVCGSENPKGMGIRWFLMDDGSIQAEHTFTIHEQGPPGFAHGGALAAVLDEAMGMAVWGHGHRVVAVQLEVEYHRPVPLNTPVFVKAWITDRGRWGIRTEGRLTVNGKIAAVSRGIYVEAPHLFDEAFVESIRAKVEEEGRGHG